MKLIGLMSFYDEAADWLTAAIASHKKCGMTDIVVCDGAYALYPGGRARSGIEQYRAIASTCEALDIGCTIHTPTQVWAGHEIEKRNFLFKLGLTVADGPQDWFIVIDADHLMTDPDDLPTLLGETDLHAAELTAWQRTDPTTAKAREFNVPRVNRGAIRLAYRANPGLHCHGNHYTYVDGEGRVLWGQRDCVPALDLTHVMIEHRTRERDKARHDDQYLYYDRRKADGIEAGPMAVCDWVGCDRTWKTTVPFDFELMDGGEALQAGHLNVCAKHAKRAHYENRVRLDKLNILYGREGELVKRHT